MTQFDFGRCPYCGATPPEDPSPEHVLPQSIGGSGLPPVLVCRSCNHRANKAIDEPLKRDGFIEGSRVRLGVGNKSAPTHRRLSQPVSFSVDDPDFGGPVEHRVLPIETREGLELRLLLTRTESDSAIKVVAGDEVELDRAMDRIRAELLASGRRFTERRERDVVVATVNIPRKPEGGTLYRRFVLKVALALAPVFLGTEWLTTSAAAAVRRALQAEIAAPGAATDIGLLDYPCPPDIENALTIEDLHTIATVPADGCTVVAVSLFGRLVGAVEVLPFEIPLERHSIVVVSPTTPELAVAPLARFRPYAEASGAVAAANADQDGPETEVTDEA